jgi:hypothetical protein
MIQAPEHSNIHYITKKTFFSQLLKTFKNQYYVTNSFECNIRYGEKARQILVKGPKS